MAWLILATGLIVGFSALALVGMIGLTRAAYRRQRLRGGSDTRLAAVTVGAAFVSFLGGWLVYLACWPGVRLARNHPRWRLAAPALSAVVLFSGFAAAANFLTPTEDVAFVNDTGNSVVLTGCTSDPASLAFSRLRVRIEIASGSRSCEVSFPESSRPYGCLYLPAHPTNETVIRISAYAPTTRDCP